MVSDGLDILKIYKYISEHVKTFVIQEFKTSLSIGKGRFLYVLKL